MYNKFSTFSSLLNEAPCGPYERFSAVRQIGEPYPPHYPARCQGPRLLVARSGISSLPSLVPESLLFALLALCLNLVESLLGSVEYVIVLEPLGSEQAAEDPAKICIAGLIPEA